MKVEMTARWQLLVTFVDASNFIWIDDDDGDDDFHVLQGFNEDDDEVNSISTSIGSNTLAGSMVSFLVVVDILLSLLTLLLGDGDGRSLSCCGCGCF